MAKKVCFNPTYKLNIEGKEYVFASKQQCSQYIRNNYNTISKLTSVDKIFESKDDNLQQMSIDRLQTISSTLSHIKTGNVLTDLSTNKDLDTVSKIITESTYENIDKKTNNKILTKWVPEFIYDNWVENTKKRLLKEGNTEEEADIIIKNNSERMDFLNESGILFHNAADLYFSELSKERYISPKELYKVYKDNFDKIAGDPDNGENLAISIFHLIKKTREAIIKNVGVGDKGSTGIKFLPEVKIKDAEKSIGGVIDLIVVDSKGHLHIYDYKFSGLANNLWSSAKKLSTSYQMYMYKRLLERNGFTVASVNIIPYHLSKANDISQVIDDYADILKKNVKIIVPSERESSKLSENIEEVLPKIKAKSISHITNVDDVKAFIKLIGDYEHTSILKGKNREKEINKVLLNRKTFLKDDQYSIWDSTTGKPYNIIVPHEEVISEATKRKIEEKVDEIIKLENAKINNLPENIGNFFKTCQKQLDKGEQVDFTQFDPKNVTSSNTLKQLIYRYIYIGKWRIIEDDAFKDMGLIGFANDETGQVDLISLTTNNINAPISFENKKKNRTSILGKYMDDYKAQRLLAKPNAKVVDIEALKTYSFVKFNESYFKTTFPNFKLGNIFIVNLVKATTIADVQCKTSYNMESMWKIIKEGVPSSDIPIKDWTIDHYDPTLALQQYIDLIFNSQSTIGNTLNQDLKKSLKSFKTQYPNITSKKELEDRLLDMQVEIQKTVKSGTLNSQPTEYDPFTNPDTFNLLNLVSRSIAFLEHMPISVEEDIRNWGLAGDSGKLTSPNNMNHQMWENMRKVASRGLANAGEETKKEIDKGRVMFSKFYREASEVSIARTRLIGDGIPAFKGLYNPETMQFKDPSQFDEKTTNFIREFCDNIWQIRKRRMLDQGMSIEEIETIKLNSYLDIPLMIGGFLSSYQQKDLTSALKDFTNDVLNPNLLFSTDESLYTRQRQQLEMLNSFDIYEPYHERGHGVEARRNTLADLDAREQKAFELDLEEVYYMYMMNDCRKREYDKVLPIIDALKTTLLMSEYNFFSSQKNVLSAITDYIDVNFYNRVVTEKGSETIAAVITKMNSTAALAVLGFNIQTGITELFTGLWAGISMVAGNRFDKDMFGREDWRKGLTFVLGDLKTNMMSVANISMCDDINEKFSLLDMDLHHRVHKAKATRKGAINFKSEWAFAFSIAPDYFYRLGMFMAQMQKDGIIKLNSAGQIKEDSAVYYKNGRMIYDESLDERFKDYLKYKGNPPTDAEAKKKYYNAKTRYDSIREILIQDGKMTEADEKLTTWYTNDQRNSLVSFSGLCYGNYNKDLKVLFSNTALGKLFSLFRTWIWAKRDKYWNPVKNNREYGWMREVVDEDGNVVGYGHEGRMMEGVLQTLSYMGHTLASHNFNITSNAMWSELTTNLNPWQKRNMIWLISDTMLLSLIVGLIALIMDGDKFKEINEKDPARAFFVKSLNSSIRELNPLNIVKDVTGQYNPLGAVGYVNDMFGLASGVLTGNKYQIQKGVNTFGIYRAYKGFFEEE